jgi:uncharacterized glyoxalase superfamily protein PhnB
MVDPMTTETQQPRQTPTAQQAPSIYPTLRYRDAPAAVDFLRQAFGLTEHEVTRTDDGGIVHAELAWDNGLLMVGNRSEAGDSPFDTEQCCLYLAVDDPDAHHDHAVAAGAEIVMPLTDQPYGSREYAARDPEGNVWCFGTYRPAP